MVTRVFIFINVIKNIFTGAIAMTCLGALDFKNKAI
jgi:hypothetical protein